MSKWPLAEQRFPTSAIMCRFSLHPGHKGAENQAETPGKAGSGAALGLRLSSSTHKGGNLRSDSSSVPCKPQYQAHGSILRLMKIYVLNSWHARIQSKVTTVLWLPPCLFIAVQPAWDLWLLLFSIAQSLDKFSLSCFSKGQKKERKWEYFIYSFLRNYKVNVIRTLLHWCLKLPWGKSILIIPPMLHMGKLRLGEV